MKSNLLISFTDKSNSFTYGVEYGRLLEKMQRGDKNIQNNGFPVRVENRLVIKVSCKHYGYIPVFGEKPILDGWINFLGIKNEITDN